MTKEELDDLLEQIPSLRGFQQAELVDKGWSTDVKFRVHMQSGDDLLLRLAESSELDKKRDEYQTIQQFSKLGIPMSQPLDLGICDGGSRIYTLLSWQEGNDAEVVLPTLSEGQQRRLGEEAGGILRRIHSLPAPPKPEEWAARFYRKTKNKIVKHRGCGISFEGEDLIIKYLEDNRRLLDGRPQRCQHGDFHVGNMIVSNDLELSIIDFNRSDFGDPWEEFNRIVFSAQVSPAFASGQIDGYFHGPPPAGFFQLLAYYIGSNAISSVYWAIPFGQKDVDVVLNLAQDVLRWFDGMSNPIPTWYSASS